MSINLLGNWLIPMTMCNLTCNQAVEHIHFQNRQQGLIQLLLLM